MAKREVHYFDESGSQNTGETTKAAKKAALGLGLKYVVVASGSGTTGVKVAEEFEDSKVKVVVVTEYAGSAEFSEKNREKLEKLDATVVTSMHAFISPAESISKIYANHCSENTIIKQVLRRFSQGTKVAAEIVMMATDAGAIPAGEDVVALAGAGEGADTAIIIKSCHADSFFDKEKGIEFREIIALPRKKKFW
ncbi:MAG: hypothetical protein JSV12_08425 [Candidatus Bathyarchaeota archaeon]|nr:MAG: hypothetical protein JSV12_08425 [Candidatus Bathyarchaeota archaeon]